MSGYGYTSFSQLVITNDGVNTTIDLDETAPDINEVVVLNVVSLDASDFIFA